MPLDCDLAIGGDAGQQRILALQALEQRRSAPVDEALGQSFVESVGELVFDRARALTPRFGAVEPIGPVCGIGPGAYVREARLQRIEIAFGALELFQFRAHPFTGRAAFRRQHVAGDAASQAHMFLGAGLAEIGQLARVPQAAHLGGLAHARH